MFFSWMCRGDIFKWFSKSFALIGVTLLVVFLASLHCELQSQSLVAFIYLSPLCAFKCLLKSPAWIHISCISFFSTLCFQMCPHWQLREYFDLQGPWRTIKSPFTLYKRISKNLGMWFSKIPGFWSTENPGIPLGPVGQSCQSGQWSVLKLMMTITLK